MRIRHFRYNAFLVENGGIKVAIDPGQNLWMFDLRSLISRDEWATVTHILVTHGDPDHYWQADRVATTANAPLIMHRSMVRESEGESRILAPRGKGLRFVRFGGALRPMSVGDSLDLGGVRVEAIEAKHGPLEFVVLGFKRRITPGPQERAGFGSIGFKIQIGRHSLVNVGDSLIRTEWEGLNPDVAMLPIGGLGNNTWTMDASDALEAVRLMSPKLVIPTHYNVPFLWTKRMAAADELQFKRDVEQMGVDCCIIHAGSTVDI